MGKIAVAKSNFDENKLNQLLLEHGFGIVKDFEAKLHNNGFFKRTSIFHLLKKIT
ncbi:MAG: hypothetical protein ACUVQP_07195 [Bacteroidales bacterium]